MLKETLQGPSENFGSNYHHKENLIYQASNYWLLATLIVILFADKILTQWFPLYFLRFVFVTYGYFFIRVDCPGNFPDRQMSDCLLFVFVTVVSRLLCCSSVLWILRSEQRKPCILRRLQYKQTRPIFQCRSHDIENRWNILEESSGRQNTTAI